MCLSPTVLRILIMSYCAHYYRCTGVQANCLHNFLILSDTIFFFFCIIHTSRVAAPCSPVWMIKKTFVSDTIRNPVIKHWPSVRKVWHSSVFWSLHGRWWMFLFLCYWQSCQIISSQGRRQAASAEGASVSSGTRFSHAWFRLWLVTMRLTTFLSRYPSLNRVIFCIDVFRKVSKGTSHTSAWGLLTLQTLHTLHWWFMFTF